MVDMPELDGGGAEGKGGGGRKEGRLEVAGDDHVWALVHQAHVSGQAPDEAHYMIFVF